MPATKKYKHHTHVGVITWALLQREAGQHWYDTPTWWLVITGLKFRESVVSPDEHYGSTKPEDGWVEVHREDTGDFIKDANGCYYPCTRHMTHEERMRLHAKHNTGRNKNNEEWLSGQLKRDEDERNRLIKESREFYKKRAKEKKQKEKEERDRLLSELHEQCKREAGAGKSQHSGVDETLWKSPGHAR